jgi:L-ascorbate oxidase
MHVLTINKKKSLFTFRSVFKVEKNKRYRFRVINSGVQFCPLQFSIDGHNLTVIATDGNDIEPLQVVSFVILAGEFD